MPRIATLDSIKKDERHDHSDEEEDGGNEYFTGGTGNQAVIAPNNNNRGGNDAMQGVVDGIQRQQQRQQSAPPPSGSGERRVAAVTLYANGFTLNDGPLRTVDDPQNKQFLENLQQGYCPPELVENGKPADVQITNRSTEPYRAPAPEPARFQAFVGAGASLGSAGAGLEGLLVPGTTDGTDGTLVVSKPTVKVLVKHDNKRHVLQFEHQHTVRHLIGKVELELEGLGPYQLLTGNPPKPLLPEQFDLTLTQAGLAGAMVVVNPCDV
ncbi:hypothetical protein BASA81_003899 [Batrachochytrium salamandrivorans]|nr:hypothetical protein BASA81_003899 [Batrachochytrium salamandrivorans]